MPDELITIFKICFLVLLYLFFFRVLRAVWTEVSSGALPAPADPAPVATPRAAAPAEPRGETRAERRARARAERATPLPGRLVVLEPAAMVGVEYPLTNGLTVGRGGDADVVLDDTFLSTRHASFEQHEGRWVVVDHRSTNGTYLNGNRVIDPADLALGDRLQLGGLVLEVR